MPNIVHFTKIEKIQVSELPKIYMVDSSSCKISANVNFTKINNLAGLIGAKVEDVEENGQKVYTTTVTFHTCDKTPVRMKRQAFRLTAVDGSQFLVGTDIRPYPIVKESNPFPEKAGDNVLKTVTITWKAPCPMLSIL